MSGGIWAIFGAGLDVFLEGYLRSITSALDFPLILPTSRNGGRGGPEFGTPTKLSPSKSFQAEALSEAVLFFNWTRVGLIYDTEDGEFGLGFIYIT